MLQQAGPQMCQVTVRISGRSNAFIYLKDMDVLPGNVFVSQVTQHNPRSMASADSHEEAPACSYGFPSVSSNGSSGSASYGIGVGEHLYLH